MAKIIWKTESGAETSVDVEDGVNLMETARANGIPYIEGECGGCLSCATCHVFVAEEWMTIVGEASEVENAMLEATNVERRDNSRLSCQITASLELDGLVLFVPEP